MSSVFSPLVRRFHFSSLNSNSSSIATPLSSILQWLYRAA